MAFFPFQGTHFLFNGLKCSFELSTSEKANPPKDGDAKPWIYTLRSIPDALSGTAKRGMIARLPKISQPVSYSFSACLDVKTRHVLFCPPGGSPSRKKPVNQKNLERKKETGKTGRKGNA